ncbi:MAG: tetratricopeptide repeat protein, partial [Maricaulaceae bacterium]
TQGCGIGQVERDWEANAALVDCAAAGDAEALTYLGLLHWSVVESEHPDWSGLDPDLTEEELRSTGWRLLREAAAKGEGAAQNELGVAYYHGDYGVDVDFDQAHSWFERAQESGDDISGYNLARMHARGDGVTADYDVAMEFLSSSAERGYAPSKCLLREVRALDAEAPESQRLAQLSSIFERDQVSPCYTPDVVSAVAGRLDEFAWTIDRAAGNISIEIEERRRRSAAVPADERSCAVYRALSRNLDVEEIKFFRPSTRYDEWRDDFDTGDPWSFSRETGETELLSIGDEQFEVPVLDHFEFDAQPLFSSIFSGPELSIDHCFGDGAGASRFTFQSLDRLYAEAAAIANGDDVFVTIYSASRVGYSEDGTYALVYEQSYCGGLCGAGGFVLLERDPETALWSVIGFRNVWVS